MYTTIIQLLSPTVILFYKELPVEQQQVESAHRHAGISEVENGAEEDDLPGGIVDQREIEHVHHAAEHERGIVPDQSIEQAIDNVTEGAGGNQSETYQNACRGLAGLIK